MTLAQARSKELLHYGPLIEATCARYAVEQWLPWNDCDSASSAHQYLKENGLKLCQDPTNS